MGDHENMMEHDKPPMDVYGGVRWSAAFALFNTRGSLKARSWFLLSWFVLCFSQATYGREIAAKPITLVFRFDDPSSRSDTEFELKLLDAFRAQNLSVTFAIVPCVSAGDLRSPDASPGLPFSAEKAAAFRPFQDAGVLEVALHGYSHQNHGRTDIVSEFATLPLAEQRDRIARGKSLLERVFGGRIKTFVPPWNRYDSSTVAAAAETGIEVFSAGVACCASGPSELSFLPLTAKLSNLREAVGAARNSPDASPLVVISIHPYDFHEIDREKGIIDYEKFVALLSWVAQQHDVSTKTLATAAASGEDWSLARYEAFRPAYNQLGPLIPPLWRPQDGLAYYPSLKTSRDIPSCLVVLLAWSTGVFFAGVVVAAGADCVLRRWSPRLLGIAAWGSLAVVVAAALYFALRDATIGWKDLSLLIFLCGNCVTTWIVSRVGVLWCVVHSVATVRNRGTSPHDVVGS